MSYSHTGRTRLAQVGVGWLLVLLTNVPLHTQAAARQVYNDWRLKGRIEHGYRFDQEQGLDVEDIRVQTLERMRKLFALVLIAAQFVYHLQQQWPPQAVHWLRQLGGKLEVKLDRDGPYILLLGLSALLHTVVTLTLLSVDPFPLDAFG